MSNQNFCKECGDLLYPKEDANEDILYAQCYNCDHFEVAENPIIHRINYKTQFCYKISEDIAQELTSDPTLPMTTMVECVNCSHNRAVYFENKENEEEKLAICYICCNCYKIFGI
ncbi:DNA-directed RNA polymerases II, IV and V subunit 9A [Dictyocoela muelleri]|nr:DNA-directed RNA polymerases II, IV and V subunit 9A [Dictyocoela muelleri]